MLDPIKIRPATNADLPFLREMLSEAAAVSETIRLMSSEQVLALPLMLRILENQGRRGDFGFVAETGDGSRAGAIWARLFPENERGHGFVSAEIPELAVAVAPAFRGRGVGTKLLENLISEARKLNYPALSLSVARQNPALKLYRRLGFADAEVSAHTDSSLTMILRF